MLAVIQYIVQELVSKKGEERLDYQKQLEQVYLENDILFNLDPKLPQKVRKKHATDTGRTAQNFDSD